MQQLRAVEEYSNEGFNNSPQSQQPKIKHSLQIMPRRAMRREETSNDS